jgi:hypothetical protein
MKKKYILLSTLSLMAAAGFSQSSAVSSGRTPVIENVSEEKIISSEKPSALSSEKAVKAAEEPLPSTADPASSEIILPADTKKNSSDPKKGN